MINEIDFVRKHLGVYKLDKSNPEILVETCPFCGNGRHNDKYCFSINYEKHVYKCWRGSCAVTGTFNDLCKQYGERAEYMKEFRQEKFDRSVIKKTYTKPKMETYNISERALSYLQLRGFSDETLKHFSIESDKNGNIVFPYFNENNERVLNKIRLPRAFKKGIDKTKIWQEGGGQPILFGMNKVNYKEPLLIIEGEMDCLTAYESGYKNVTSIPFGTENQEWINECWDFLQKFDNILLWYDNDKAGIRAVEEVARKIGLYKCKIVKSEYKDANILMYKEGKEAVLNAINQANFIPIENLQRLVDCKTKEVDRILFGNKFLDYNLGGCRMGELTVWTGKRGSGKSTILNQTLVDSVEQKCKCFLYTGELNNSKAKQWLERQIAGEKYIVTFQDELTRREEYGVHPSIVPIIEKWYEDYLYVYGDEGADEIEDLIEIMEYAYRRYNCKRFIIDNLKTLRVSESKDFYRQQAAIINTFRKFVINFNVHIDLVVHPRKTQNTSLSDEDVGGISDIIDLAHNIIEIQRIYEDNLPADANEKYFENDTILRILKNREYGDVGNESFYKFNPKSKRIYGKTGIKRYSWEDSVEDENIVLNGDKNEQKEVICPWD